MLKTAKLVTIIMMVASLVFIPVGSAFSAEEASGEAMIGDLLVLRPLGFIAMVAGSVFFVISYPFSAAGGNVDEASQKLVKDPADYTFKRALGDV